MVELERFIELDNKYHSMEPMTAKEYEDYQQCWVNLFKTSFPHESYDQYPKGILHRHHTAIHKQPTPYDMRAQELLVAGYEVTTWYPKDLSMGVCSGCHSPVSIDILETSGRFSWGKCSWCGMFYIIHQ